eukprot:12931816-Prorocentrum_lima.AAC.1
MWGPKDAPRAFGVGLSRSLQENRYQQGVIDRQIWRKLEKNSKPVTSAHCGFHPQMASFISTHIDDIKGGATDAEKEPPPRNPQETLRGRRICRNTQRRTHGDQTRTRPTQRT